MKLAPGPRRRARIEIIPMIDTVFFLLVFFMMASLSMTMARGLPVSLPAAAGAAPAPADAATVTLSRDGGTYLDRQPVAPGELASRLRALLAAAPQALVVIHADQEVPHGRVVATMDLARSAGAVRLAVAVRPPDSSAR